MLEGLNYLAKARDDTQSVVLCHLESCALIDKIKLRSPSEGYSKMSIFVQLWASASLRVGKKRDITDRSSFACYLVHGYQQKNCGFAVNAIERDGSTSCIAQLCSSIHE